MMRLKDGPLALEVINVFIERAILHAHLLCECGGWLPLGRGTWGGLFEHLVDLLKRQALQILLA